MPEAARPLASPAKPPAGPFAGRLWRGRRRSWAAAICVAFCALPSWAGPTRGVPDQASLDLSAMLEAFEARLAEPAAHGLPADALIEAAGLAALARAPDLPVPPGEAGAPWVAALTGAPGAPAEALRLSTRLALVMLSQAHGDEDNYAIMAAQTDPAAEALVIRSGHATLADLRRLLEEHGLPFEAEGRALTLRVPLVLWPDSSLWLGPGDELRLSRTDGAFVVGFGRVDVEGATLAATGEANRAIPSFAPFVVMADGGTIMMRGARVRGLGFGETLKFSGLSVLGSLLRPAARPSRIESSTFEDVASVSASGAEGLVLRGNQFRDMRGGAIIVSRTRDARILSNLFVGAATTNAMRIEDGSSGALIAGNVLLGGERAGILVRGASVGVTVTGNVVWRRDGGGISVIDSGCGTIEGNLVIDNQQKGIELRASPGSALSGNTVYSNHSAGIWISHQPGASTVLRANILAFNGAGLAGALGGSILMEGNDFSGQFQQFLSGDLALQTANIARDMRGLGPIVLGSDVLGATLATVAAAPASACVG